MVEAKSVMQLPAGECWPTTRSWEEARKNSPESFRGRSADTVLILLTFRTMRHYISVVLATGFVGTLLQPP